MDNQIIGKVLEYLENIGKAVSNGATYGFELLVKQQLISGIVWTGFNMMWIILTFFIVKAFFKRYKTLEEKEEKDRYFSIWEDDIQIWVLTVTGTIFLVGSIINLICLPDNVMSIFNPEYYAIKDVMKMIKPTK